MKAVMANALPEILAWRKRTGADRYDEMWNGVLHMAPVPNRVHQDFATSLLMYLRLIWAPHHQAKAYPEINIAPIGGWPNDYRIPDLVLLLPERFAIDRNDYFEGAPTAVVEIHSPGDEAYEKLSFYAELGVPEVWIIHRDSKEPEIHVLRGKRYRQPRASRGWLRGPKTRIELAQAAPGKLAIRLAGDESTRRELPED